MSLAPHVHETHKICARAPACVGRDMAPSICWALRHGNHANHVAAHSGRNRQPRATRQVGPEKGVVHMANGALINALWDLWAKREGKPGEWRTAARRSDRRPFCSFQGTGLSAVRGRRLVCACECACAWVCVLMGVVLSSHPSLRCSDSCTTASCPLPKLTSLAAAGGHGAGTPRQVHRFPLDHGCPGKDTAGRVSAVHLRAFGMAAALQRGLVPWLRPQAFCARAC